MKRINRVYAVAAALMVGALFVQVTAYAKPVPNPKPGPRSSRIVGVWDVQVTNTNCATGAPIFSFAALHKFEYGGTGQVVPNSSPAALSAHMMIWSYVAHDDYLMAVKMFRFDEAGNNIGWIVLNNEVSINEAADEYQGSGVAEIFDAGGNLVGVSCPVLEGTRFTGE